jgi:hypothetical protein
MSGEPDRFMDKVVGWAIGLFVASIALYGAVAIIGMIWSTLVMVLGAGLIVAVLVAVWRNRSRGW